ncbi:MAG: hypothetical protein ACM3RX_05585 [Methanococcaceae archaeon]
MLIFRDSRHKIQVNERLDYLNYLPKLMAFNDSDLHDKAVDLLISFGELEAGLTDYLNGQCDNLANITNTLRQIGILTGKIFLLSLTAADLNDLINSFFYRLHLLRQMPLPVMVEISVPEGFAYYSLYPEMYVKAAERFLLENPVKKIVSLGIRSIGTSLSSVIAAFCSLQGVEVISYTLRPRGNYYDRELVLGKELEKEIASLQDAAFLIIDEGPGLSGSTMASTARKLFSLGVAQENIFLFPAWNADPKKFISPLASEQWDKYKIYQCDFEETGILKTELEDKLGLNVIENISAGAWRKTLFNNISEFPPVWQMPERRKYLCVKRGVPTEKYILKFAGLGMYGLKIYETLKRMSLYRITSEVLDFKSGFILMSFIDGKLLSDKAAHRNFLDTAAEYLSMLNKQFTTERSNSLDEIAEMIYINVQEGLGKDIRFKRAELSLLEEMPAVVIDGHMMPYEWIDAGGRILKTDAAFHHNDHFLPGPQDIAYDIAGLFVEFSLNEEKQDYFIKKFIAQTADSTILKRLPFYELVYCAFRLGFVSFAFDACQNQWEQKEFLRLKRKYLNRIKNYLLLLK